MRRPLRTVLLVLTALCLVMLAPVTANAAPARAAKKPVSTTSSTVVGARAMWVWTRPAPSTLVDLAQRNGVGELFLCAPTRPCRWRPTSPSGSGRSAPTPASPLTRRCCNGSTATRS